MSNHKYLKDLFIRLFVLLQFLCFFPIHLYLFRYARYTFDWVSVLDGQITCRTTQHIDVYIDNWKCKTRMKRKRINGKPTNNNKRKNRNRSAFFSSLSLLSNYLVFLLFYLWENFKQKKIEIEVFLLRFVLNLNKRKNANKKWKECYWLKRKMLFDCLFYLNFHKTSFSNVVMLQL